MIDIRSDSYWQKRYESVDNLLYNMSLESYLSIEKALKEVQKETNNQIEKWFYRIATNNDITMLKAKQKLNAKELEEFKWDVNEYIEKLKENNTNQQWIKELENASAKAHITRLQALQLHTQQIIEKAYGNQLDEVDNMIRNIYKEGYNRSNWIMQTGMQTGFNMGNIDERQLNEIIKKPWAKDGKEFSSRIWTHKTNMVNSLHNELMQTVTRGGSPDKAIKHMVQYVDKSNENAKRNASRLVQSEQAYFSTVSKMKSYEDLEVERYQNITTFDLKVSEKCKSMDKKIFKLSEMEIGVNAPPYHANCRTTTSPVLGKRYVISTRAARDKDGKTIQIPEDMTYQEWYDQYILGKENKKVTKTEDSKTEDKSIENILPTSDNNGIIKNNITDKDRKAINDYISSESYSLNEKLRTKVPLDIAQQEKVKDLDVALKKMPTYKGDLTRTLDFFHKDDIEKFVDMHKINSVISYNQYISTTFGEIYSDEAQIIIYIENAKKGRNISMYNGQEKEILYERNISFEVIDVKELENQTVLINLREV